MASLSKIKLWDLQGGIHCCDALGMSKWTDESSVGIQPAWGRHGSQAVTEVQVQEHCSFASSRSPLGHCLWLFPIWCTIFSFQLLGLVAHTIFLFRVKMPYRKCIWVLTTHVSGSVLSSATADSRCSSSLLDIPFQSPL